MPGSWFGSCQTSSSQQSADAPPASLNPRARARQNPSRPERDISGLHPKDCTSPAASAGPTGSVIPTSSASAPLAGLRVLDFSTLLPGPLATLILFEAGADVVKVERPPAGDEMRSYQPLLGGSSANFALLNRGKRSVVADLNNEAEHSRILALALAADVLIEQFRPGVLERLGLGYDHIAENNPGIIYCSITGYGQTGPHKAKAGHDLTYLAESGLLSLVADAQGQPVLPPGLIADIAGGAYPAVMNVLLGLEHRRRFGTGLHIDISMTQNLFPFMYWVLADHAATGTWPGPGTSLLTGNSCRYRFYRTSDSRYLAVAALEDRFWRRFCDLIGLPQDLSDDNRDPRTTALAVESIIASRTGTEWEALFRDQDVCCSIVATPAEGVLNLRADYERLLVGQQYCTSALPVPLTTAFRHSHAAAYPEFGQHTHDTLWGEETTPP